MNRYLRTRGFTIVELLIVIVVIGILVGVTVVSFNGIEQSAREKSIMSDLDNAANEVTRYSTKNSGKLGTAVMWYSAGAANPNIKFTPSPGNVIDIAASSSEYCIRGYNPASTSNSITNAKMKESSAGVCAIIDASVAAGGSWVGPDVAGDGTPVALPAAHFTLNGSASEGIAAKNGVVTGATLATGANGAANGAYEFSGSGMYITAPASIPKPTSALSVSAWFKPSAISNANAQKIVSRQESGGFGLMISSTGAADCQTRLAFVVYSDGINTSACTNAGTISNGAWAYGVGVFDTSSSNVKVYLNGVLAQTVSVTGSMSYGPSASTVPFCIGAEATATNCTGGLGFAGDIDDVRLYDRALTDAEILTLYNNGAQ